MSQPVWQDVDALLALAGRVFIAVIFVASGFGKITIDEREIEEVFIENAVY